MRGHDFARLYSIRSLYDVASYFGQEPERFQNWIDSIQYVVCSSLFLTVARGEKSLATFEVQNVDLAQKRQGPIFSCSGIGLPYFAWFHGLSPIQQLELDCRGHHDIVSEDLVLEIAEIKSDAKQVPKAAQQLQRALLLLFWAAKVLFPAVQRGILKGRVYYTLGKEPEPPLNISSGDYTLSIIVSKI